MTDKLQPIIDIMQNENIDLIERIKLADNKLNVLVTENYNRCTEFDKLIESTRCFMRNNCNTEDTIKCGVAVIRLLELIQHLIKHKDYSVPDKASEAIKHLVISLKNEDMNYYV